MKSSGKKKAKAITIQSINAAISLSATSSTSSHLAPSMTPLTPNERRKRQERMERFSSSKPTNGPVDNTNINILTYSGPNTPGSALQIINDSITSYSDHSHDLGTSTTARVLNRGTAVPFLGTNMQLEKSYLRLTTYPCRENVRPLRVLIKALDHVKRKYQQNDDFEWCHDQLRSIRQDITVQSIRHEQHPFVLDVYQTHARVLLEHGHLSEFNQCLTNILQCYNATSIASSSTSTSSTTTTADVPTDGSIPTSKVAAILNAEGEFRAYSILYSLIHKAPMDMNVNLRRRLMHQQHLLMALSSSGTDGNIEPAPPPPHHQQSSRRKKRRRRASNDKTCTEGLDAVGTKLTTKTCSAKLHFQMSDEEEHAWKVVRAIYDGMYTNFFRLYNVAPHMSPYLMDFLVHRVRVNAYHAIITSYRPTISVEYVGQCLQMDTIDETKDFLQQRNAVYATQENPDTHDDNGNSPSLLLIDCRPSQQHLTV
jgi:hypothetical protein